MATAWLVGIDDTDNAESIGTGRLARMLAEHLEARELLTATSVTRHQLLVHPDIPYTSHNSSACIAGLSEDASRAALAEVARGFLQEHFHDGANPGLCVCAAEAVPGVPRGAGQAGAAGGPPARRVRPDPARSGPRALVGR